MIDAKKLFKSGKRYRGFASVGGNYVPVGFNVYPISSEEIRIRHLFPSRVGDKIKEGSLIYVLLEDEEKLVAEVRIVRREERGILASLDFVTEDKRKLPRVKVEGFLDVEAEILCQGSLYTGKVVDLSLSSVGIKTEGDIPSGECELTIKYRNKLSKFTGKVVRKDESITVFEILNGNNEMTELLQRIYADLFLKAQRLS